ncbi:ester cyclase [Superficieibacter sp.]|uniref:ester cyclase n=1 Tax=Superficieibacter sp. TaxID=2303322 RepID=UPI0028A9D9D0|nr:ester cyclase [Superficieibacter sp.]
MSEQKKQEPAAVVKDVASAAKKSPKEHDGIVYYGNSAQVNSLGYLDYNDFAKITERKQKLEGFDPKYRDIVDYILRITHEIWEERGVGVIFDTYHNNTIAHNCSLTSSGVLPVIAGTLSHLHAFPDRRIVGESVIWSEDHPGYYFSSHRSASTATNLGDSNFGPATGKKIHFRAIADCAIHKNRIYEEWLVRDNLWVVKQLGFDPYDVARRMAKTAPVAGSPALKSPFGLAESVEGQFYPQRYTEKDNSVGEMIKGMYQNIFQCKLINLVKQYFDANAKVHFICDKDLCGREEIQGTIISFLASFPNALHVVERVTYNDRPGQSGYDVAVRWRLRGLHEGIGMFGSPGGKYVEIMGIDHFWVDDNKIQEAWVMFDGLDVIRQIIQDDDETTASGHNDCELCS